MPSLFSKLLRLDSTEKEDFHTEIVAHVLRNSPDLAFRWFRAIGATRLTDFDRLFVSSQEELDPLAAHEGIGSRPDIAVQIIKGEEVEVIFVESKIGSTENPGQLQKYAEHLEAQRATRKCLVFVTRDYEPKNWPENNRIQFVPKRWSEFYRFAKQQPDRDAVTSELLKFMEEHNMNQSNQFTPLDLLSLTNFTKARKLMDQTMWESVARKFRNICGSKFSYPTDASLQFHQYSRYVMYSGQGKDVQLLLTLGYWIDDTSIVNSPTVGIRIFVNPKAAARADAITAMQAFLRENPTWCERDLHDPKSWSCICAERSLQSFVGDVAGDHVKTVAEYFEHCLDELRDFIVSNRQLPWNSDVLADQPESQPDRVKT